MALISAAAAGLLFGIGLIIAGMTDPAKVLAFLDVAGAWDPSLALVMVSAILFARVGFVIATRRGHSLYGEAYKAPEKRPADRRVLLGSAIFGSGWGLAGYCPGPVVVATGSGSPAAAIVLLALLLGLWAASRFLHRASRPS